MRGKGEEDNCSHSESQKYIVRMTKAYSTKSNEENDLLVEFIGYEFKISISF